MMCDCPVCFKINLLDEHLAKIEDEDVKKFFINLSESYISIETDRDYYKAIIQGVYPDADTRFKEIRAAYRKEHAEKYI